MVSQKEWKSKLWKTARFFLSDPDSQLFYTAFLKDTVCLPSEAVLPEVKVEP